MKKLFIFLSLIFSSFTWFSLAISTVLNPSYSTNWDNTKIYRTDNSDRWNINIKIQNPETKDEIEFGPIKISDQAFTYTNQRDWNQEIQIIPDDWWNKINFTITSDSDSKSIISNEYLEESRPRITRTVIPVVPRTGPSMNMIWCIIASLVIFCGYIYIKKRADI